MNASATILTVIFLCACSDEVAKPAKGPTPGVPYVRLNGGNGMTTTYNTCTAIGIDTVVSATGSNASSVASPVATDTLVTVSFGAGFRRAVLYADSSCLAQSSTATIAAGASATTIYIMDKMPGETVVLSAAAASYDSSPSIVVRIH